MKRIGVIGGGIFGISAALELAKNYVVTLYERSNSILSGASTSNHLRHHYGYHYPRSKKTALESINARQSFEKKYGGCICKDVQAYYGVSKANSKTSAEDFLKFCNELNLPYKIEFPKKEYLDRSKVELCIKVPEPVYDPFKLSSLIQKKIVDSNLILRLNHEIIGGKIEGKNKILRVSSKSGIKEEAFDYLINATYCNFNIFNKWFGFPEKRFLYESIELLEISLPMERLGLTIIDGEFSSVLPRGEKSTFTLGHVKESVLEAKITDSLDSYKMPLNASSNKERIIQKGIEDFPAINNAKVLNSIFVARIVKADVDNSDERPTEITDYGNGIYSIFAGKVITCVETAKAVGRLIKKI